MSGLNPAPVLRGSFADSLPSDLKEMATWLNKRVPDTSRPRCARCSISMAKPEDIKPVRMRVVYIPASGGWGHVLAWGCPNYLRCGAPPKKADEAKLFAYAKKRLRHQPRDCVRYKTV